jgi:hypothetical protein
MLSEDDYPLGQTLGKRRLGFLLFRMNHNKS